MSVANLLDGSTRDVAQSPSDYAAYKSRKKFESLDGLRALSILAVIWHHTAPDWTGPKLAHAGANGVTLFFAISGFLITTLLLRERDRSGAIDLKAFYMRRALRIFPLYYGVLLVYVALVAVMERNTSPGISFFNNLIYFATYTSNIFVPLDGRVIFYFSWSLATEEQFYLIWPSVLILTRTRTSASLLLIAIIGGCYVGYLLNMRVVYLLPVSIVAGSLVAITLHSKKGYDVLKAALGAYWMPVLFLVLSILAVTVLPVSFVVVHLLFAGLVASCVIREDHMLRYLLTIKPVAYIGSISYGMYMLHMLCKNVVVALLAAGGVSTSGIQIFILTTLVAIGVAGFSFRYYESNFLKMKVRWAVSK